MARAVDLINTRLRALLDGSYTAGGRYVTGATFTEAKPVNASASVEWQDVVKDRVWDIVWSSQGDENDVPQNTFQGPHALAIVGTLRVQYAVDRVGGMEPPPAGGGGGPLGTAAAPTLRALGDAEQLRWILSHTPVWSGVATRCTVGRHTATQAGLRVVLEMPLEWGAMASADTAPGWGS